MKVKYQMFTSKIMYPYVSYYVGNNLFVIIREITVKVFRQVLER